MLFLLYNVYGDNMDIINIINKKRDKQVLSYDELFFTIDSYMKDEVKDYQVSSLLMAICLNGMSEEETINLTKIMLNSGDILDMSNISGIKVDKHSTGGVGDKTTLIVAPLVATCGVNVGKMSGRGLGHTGGTIDKLESIKNFNVNLSEEEFVKQINEIGVAITTSSLNIVPADKKIYSLRNSSGTVSSIPLIAASIMSKKLATNADKIVFDVKVGNGALLKTKEEAITLAKLMIKISNNFNKETVALITDMNCPLGNCVGNGLEVLEAIEILKGKGSSDLRKLCITLASYMVSLGKNISFEAAQSLVTSKLDDGSAYSKFLSMVKCQGGNIDDIVISSKTVNYQATKVGYINGINALILGEFVKNLGAGRINKDDIIDYGVGVVLNHKLGDYINKGDILLTAYINKDEDLSILDNVFEIDEIKKEFNPLIYGIVK